MLCAPVLVSSLHGFLEVHGVDGENASISVFEHTTTIDRCVWIGNVAAPEKNEARGRAWLIWLIGHA